jgi:hypothetical protein
MASDADCGGALLLFPVPPEGAPYREASLEIDANSGGYGYTHMGVECCNDAGKPVIIDAGLCKRVVRCRPITDLAKSPDKHQARPYGRVTLESLNLDPTEFCKLAKALVGQPYSLDRVGESLPDSLKQFTNDPPQDGLLCTDVVIRSMPEDVVDRLYQIITSTRPEPLAAGIGSDGRKFFTPNGLAFALGLRPASELTFPGQELTPGSL